MVATEDVVEGRVGVDLVLLARVVAQEDTVCVRWSLVFLVDILIVIPLALISW